MKELVKRLQILLTEEQFDFLKGLSSRKGISVSDLVRRAVERVYRPSVSYTRIRALEELEKNIFLKEAPTKNQ